MYIIFLIVIKTKGKKIWHKSLMLLYIAVVRFVRWYETLFSLFTLHFYELSSLVTVLCVLQGLSGLGQVCPDSSLVHGVQQVLGVQCQRVGGGQHLPLALLLQRGDGVLLRQTHFVDQLAQVFVQQFLRALNLQRNRNRRRRQSYVLIQFFSFFFYGNLHFCGLSFSLFFKHLLVLKDKTAHYLLECGISWRTVLFNAAGCLMLQPSGPLLTLGLVLPAFHLGVDP